ncbi:MAG: hypothetical protein ACYDHW_13155 [Syntrophorhabdaceae bacterium]
MGKTIVTEQQQIVESIDVTLRRRFPHIMDRENVLNAEEYQELMDSQTCSDCLEFQHGFCLGQFYHGMNQIIRSCILPPLLLRDN